MSEKIPEDKSFVRARKATVTLPGTVEKIIPPITPCPPEKAQIAVEGAEHLYREIRVENTFQDADGNEVSLKKGASRRSHNRSRPRSNNPKEVTISNRSQEKGELTWDFSRGSWSD